MPRKPTAEDPAEPAGKAVTIKDIAARLGVSHATVSRALNDHPATSAAAKARVRDAAEALGYIRNANAGSLSGASSRLIGFITPEVQSDFYATLASVLAASCAAAGQQLILAVSGDDPELEHRHVLALRQARVAGVVITPTLDLSPKSAELLAPLPVVQLVRAHASLDKPRVGINDRIGIGLATRHLLELGHRRIGFIGGFRALTTGHDREAGYREALIEAGLPYDETLVVLGSPRASFGLEATVHLTQKANPITALVLGSSQLTIGALRAFQQLDLIAPRDLSVVGYSDPEWFRIWGPGLTTIGLPIEDLASSAAQVLFSAMAAPQTAVPIRRGGVFFQPHLIERGSTAPIE